MEKPRMAGPVLISLGLLRLPRAPIGLAQRFLFGCLLLLAPLWPVAAQQDVVLLESLSPEHPQAGGEFTLTLGLNWPRPAEVRYSIPDLPPGITLKMAKIEGSLHRGASGTDQPGPDVRWTEIIFTFSAARDGEYVVGPFPVFVPGHELSSSAVHVAVESPGGPRRESAFLVWESLPASLVAGEGVELRLLLKNALPEASSTCLVDAAEGTLLETLPLTDRDRAAGAVARFRLTAIASGHVRLNPARLLSPSLSTLRSPSVDFEVLSAPSTASGGGASRAALPADARSLSDRDRASSFSLEGPALPALPAFLLAPSRAALSTAAGLWEKGAYPEALAALRAAERHSPSGPALSAIREAAERALGLPPSPAEPWAPPLLLIPLGALLLFLSIFLFLYARFRAREKPSAIALRRAALPLALGLLAMGWWAFVELDGQGRAFRGRPAVIHACPAWLVPEASGGSSAEFSGGEAVRLFPGDENWSYVEAADGRSGWIAAKNAVLY